jgi:hypothetical protein
VATKIVKTIPKSSVKIWRPIVEKLDQTIETACLRRDAYLAKVLACGASCQRRLQWRV